MQKLTRLLRFLPLVFLASVGASLAVACGSSTSDGGSSGRTGADPDTGAPAADASPDAASDAPPSTGTKANGEPCSADGDCKSGHCLTQGAGGGLGDGG